MSDVTITCPCCGDIQPAPNDDPLFFDKNVAQCTACAARIIYGTLAPRIVVEPTTVLTPDGGRDVFVIRFQDATTREDMHVETLDPQYAFLLAQNIISLVRP